MFFFNKVFLLILLLLFNAFCNDKASKFQKNKNSFKKNHEKTRLNTDHVYHLVKAGDTWIHLSIKYKVSIKEFLKINHEKKLKIGVLIKLPFKKKIALKKPETTFKNLNFIIPTQKGSIIQNYGKKKAIMNYGIFFKSKNNQNQVYASEKGIINYVGFLRGYGKSLFLVHSNGWVSVYSGFKKLYKQAGEKVFKGEIIGIYNKQLFFSIFQKGEPFNPNKVIRLEKN